MKDMGLFLLEKKPVCDIYITLANRASCKPAIIWKIKYLHKNLSFLIFFQESIENIFSREYCNYSPLWNTSAMTVLGSALLCEDGGLDPMINVHLNTAG